MVTNELGQVGIKYYQTIPHVVVAKGIQYAFVVKFNICFCWVDIEAVEAVLNTHRKKKCCGGGSKPQEYFYANESDVRIWTGVSSR